MASLALQTLLGLSVAGTALAQSATATSCSDVQIFIGLGHQESWPGAQESIAKLVCQGLSSCAYASLAYNNQVTGQYCTNQVEDLTIANETISAYVEMCPDSQILLQGWSQV
jgi:hypothetical protein